jgi:hypothetical protein
MTWEEKLKNREAELKPLILCLKSAVDLVGRQKAKELARLTLEKYADDRFVAPYEDIPKDKRWSTFRDDIIHRADDIEYSIEKHDENMVKVKYMRCMFFEIFDKHGLGDFVPIYCQTDYTACKKVHPGISMTHSKTIAGGAPHCNHEWIYSPDEE